MRVRTMAGLPLLALLACRGSPFSSGLGPGAALPASEVRSEAQALASLILVEGTFHDETAPVLRVQGGRAYVLLGDRVWGSDLPKLRATFTSEAGARQTVGDALVIREGVQLGKQTLSLLSFPLPDFPVAPAPVVRGAVPGALRAVALRRSGPPQLADVVRAGEVAGDGTFPLKYVNPNTHAGPLLLDGERGQLAAVHPDGETATAMDRVLQALAGQPGRTVLRRVREGQACRVEAELAPDDPLGSLLEAGLVLGKPGVEWAIPDVWHADPRAADLARLQGEKPPPLPPSPVVPVGRRLVARAGPGADGRFQLSAEVDDCEAVQFAQVVLVGAGERWLSWPYRLPAAGAPPVPVAADREAWRIERAPAGASLAFPGAPVPLPPARPSDAACRPPLAPLDPDGVYVVARKERFDERCRDGLLVYPPGAEDQARCVERERFEVIGSDGLPIYDARRPQGGADAPDYRRAVPDACSRDAEGQCQLAGPRLNDDLLASSPCGARAAPAWYGPDGEIVFACPQEYRRRDGTPLELHGATLVRLGERGTALVRLPWGMLGVLGPDGKGREVGGLPASAGLRSPPSAAVRDGFLVAASSSARSPGELGAPEALELFHVSFEGTATSRGAFPPLGREASAERRLGPDGALYTLPASSQVGIATRWAIGEAPRVLYDSWKQKPDERAEYQPLLFGWRAAAPGRTDGRPVQPHEAPPHQQALAAYALADPATLPCRAPLGRLDPERVWIRLHGWVFDPLDPARFAWSEESAYEAVELKVGGDGQLLTLRRDLTTSAPVERRVEALATAVGDLRPSSGGCARFPGSAPPAPVRGGSCGARVEAKGSWEPVPVSSEARLQCAAAWPKRETLVGDATLPEGLFLVHAGTGGRLLFAGRPRGPRFARDPQPADRWLLALPDGRQVPLPGVPPIVHAIRAAPDGFLLVAAAPPAPEPPRRKGPPVPPPAPARPQPSPQPPPPSKPPLALFLLTDDGRLRALGTYPALPGDAGLEDLALAGDRSLHAILLRFNVGVREVRLPLGGKELEVEWEARTPISANVMELLTGP